MGIKKRTASVTAKSEDKRARLEAGLDLPHRCDLADTSLQHVVREVTAPAAKLQLMEAWLTQLKALLTAKSLPKASSPPHTSAPPLSVSTDVKFPGAKLLCVCPSPLLSSHTLVFPQASDSLLLCLQFSKAPRSLSELLSFWSHTLAQLRALLVASSDLVEVGSDFYSQDLFSALPCLSVRPRGKLSKYLTIYLVPSVSPSLPDTASLSPEVLYLSSLHIFSAGLLSELSSLLSSPSYKTLLMGLQIWTRQVHLSLPPHLLEVLLLHCDNTGLITPHMKPWLCLRKLLTFLASSPLLTHDLILGVAEPVPSSPSHSHCCPLLDRGATTALFPGMPRSQWQVAALLASKAAGEGVEQTLLTSLLPEAFYDRVFEVTGCATSPPHTILSSVHRGLGERVTSLALVGGHRTWSDPAGLDKVTLRLGVRLESSLYWQPTSRGPEATDENASEEFRQFWGERSQLRRFQDGAVCEAVVWRADRQEVVGDIVRAVVARHHGGCHVLEKGVWGAALLQGDGGVEARTVLDNLVPELYGLEGVALKVASVAPAGGVARASRVGDTTVRRARGKTVKEKGGVCVVTGKGGMAATGTRPLDVVLTAEHSGKWPLEEEAARRVRLAWLMELGKALKTKVPSLVVRVAGERLLVVSGSTVLRLAATDSREPQYECQLTSWLSGVSKTFPAWSGAVRLCLRWAAAHLMSSVPEVALEVTCAAVLTSCAHPPTSPTAAFVLFLATLSSHDWNNSPLISPGCSSLLPRSSLPPLAVLVPHSPSPSHWTKDVSWAELQRLVSLSTASLAKLEPQPLDIFTPSLSCYEVLIHLRPLQVASRHLAVGAARPEAEPTEAANEAIKVIPIVEHEPVDLYVEQLSRGYGSLANFYYDRYGGKVVAVKLKNKEGEGAKEERGKVQFLSAKMVCEAGVAVNWGAVLEDWRILGEGLVKEIQVIDTDALL